MARSSTLAVLAVVWLSWLRPTLGGAQTVPIHASPTPPRIALEEAMRRAVERNPSRLVALQEVLRYQALLTETRSGFLPALSANVFHIRLDHNRTVHGVILQNRDTDGANLALTIPLFAPRAWILSRVANGSVSAARFDAEEAARQVALATAHAYLTVLVQHRVVEIDERALDNARSHYEYTHARLEGGIGNELDDTRAAQDASTSEATLEQAMAQLIQAQEILGVLVGADGPLDVELEVKLPSIPQEDDLATFGRPDVLASQQRVSVARVFRRNIWTEFAPQVNGILTPFYQHPPTALMPRFGWIVQVGVSVPLVAGGLRVGQLREREAILAQNRAQLEGVVRQARSDVRVAWSAIERADAGLVSSLRAAELARDSRRMADAAYRAGATTNIELIDAERRARDAETSAALAEDTARRARLDLLAAMGKLP